MLMRLLRHELRATGRGMLPLLGLLLLSALGANVAIRSLTGSSQVLFRLLGTALIALFPAALAGVLASTFGSTVRRFRSNLLQDEGYLMMTLPVSVHQHLWCKVIVPALWFVSTAALSALAVVLMSRKTAPLQKLTELLRSLQALYDELGSYLDGSPIDRFLTTLGYFKEPKVLWLLAAAALLGALCICLHCYAALAVGHSFSRGKGPLSVLSFLLMGVAVQFVGLGGKTLLTFLGLMRPSGPAERMASAESMAAGIGLLIAAEILYAAVFYAVTAVFLRRRLNLD